MGKGFGSVYKHIQLKISYSSTNITLVVPPRLLFISKSDSTDDWGVIVIYHNQTLPVSNLTATTQVDNDSNNDDDTHYFSTLIKHKPHNPKTSETISTTTTPAQHTVYYCPCQKSYSISITSLELPPYGK